MSSFYHKYRSLFEDEQETPYIDQFKNLSSVNLNKPPRLLVEPQKNDYFDKKPPSNFKAVQKQWFQNAGPSENDPYKAVFLNSGKALVSDMLKDKIKTLDERLNKLDNNINYLNEKQKVNNREDRKKIGNRNDDGDDIPINSNNVQSIRKRLQPQQAKSDIFLHQSPNVNKLIKTNDRYDLGRNDPYEFNEKLFNNYQQGYQPQRQQQGQQLLQQYNSDTSIRKRIIRDNPLNPIVNGENSNMQGNKINKSYDMPLNNQVLKNSILKTEESLNPYTNNKDILSKLIPKNTNNTSTKDLLKFDFGSMESPSIRNFKKVVNEHEDNTNITNRSNNTNNTNKPGNATNNTVNNNKKQHHFPQDDFELLKRKMKNVRRNLNPQDELQALRIKTQSLDEFKKRNMQNRQNEDNNMLSLKDALECRLIASTDTNRKEKLKRLLISEGILHEN